MNEGTVTQGMSRKEEGDRNLSFGDWLRAEIHKSGGTVAGFEEFSGLSVGHWLSGARSPSARSIDLLACFLHRWTGDKYCAKEIFDRLSKEERGYSGESFGRWLRSLIESEHRSINAFASVSGFPYASIHDWINDRRCLQTEQIFPLARALSEWTATSITPTDILNKIEHTRIKRRKRHKRNPPKIAPPRHSISE